MKSRKEYLDSASGLLIIYMIIYHCSLSSNIFDTYKNWVCLFAYFMPWFFYKSGMFFKETSIKSVFVKGINKLIVPYIIFSLIGIIIFALIKAINRDITFDYLIAPFKEIIMAGAPSGNAPLWFLLSLFSIQLLAQLIYRFRYRLCMFCIISIITLPLCIVSQNHRIPLFIINVPLGLTFYGLGYILRDLNPKAYIVVIATVIYYLIMLLYPEYVDMRLGKCILGSIWLYYPISLLGIISLNGLCKILLNNKNLLSVVGKHSFAYYVLHFPLIIIAANIFRRYLYGVNLFYALCLTCAIILPAITYAIKGSRWAKYLP